MASFETYPASKARSIFESEEIQIQVVLSQEGRQSIRVHVQKKYVASYNGNPSIESSQFFPRTDRCLTR